MTITDILMFCRITIVLAFVLAVIGKAQDVGGFQEAILDFQLLPPHWSKVFAWIFLSAETLVVFLMVIGKGLLLLGFILAVLLLIAFAFALFLVLLRNKRIVCNCFGRTERRISSYDVVRNVLFTACCLLGIWTLTNSQQNLSVINMILISLMAACFVTIVTSIADVAETLRKPFHIIK